jgi:dipeptidyl aminopeptidase/acylaminoacyl peptidase
MFTLRSLSLAFLSLMLGGSAATAQQRAMTLVDLLDVPALSEPELSPDGQQLLYVRSDADWEENSRFSHIWRVNIDGTGAVQMTNGDRGESNARWSPDGATIAFVADRSEDDPAQIFLLPNAGGEARALTSHETAVSSIAWSPDGRYVYFIASDPKTAEEKEREELHDDVYALDEDYKLQHLWRVAVFDGREEQVTDGDYNVNGYTLSRDGTHAALHRGPNPLFGDYDQAEVWVMSVDDPDAMVRITENAVWENGASLSPDNQTVMFTSNSGPNFEAYYNSKIWLAAADGSEPPRRLHGDRDFDVQGAAWSASGQSVYFGANMGVHSQLWRMDAASGELEQVTDGEHALRGWSYSRTMDAVVVGIDSRTNAGDFWYYPMSMGEPRRITHVFDYLAEDFRIPRQERLVWQASDGTEVEGLVFYPLDYVEGQRYPLVVQTHGGPASSDRFGFQSSNDYVQVLTAMGYVVLQPNYRGSTGYGDEFLRDMVGHYFQNAHLDVMDGVDALIDRGVVDGERMAKMGWSAGGHMTNKIITFTDRFKAASSGAGAANWVSMYGQSDVRTYRTPWFGGTPWQENAPIDVYWEHSPLKDIANVTTPTLVLVGENDVRVPPPQSVELHRGLKSNGVPTHLYIAPREPHGWRELRHRLFKANVELDWFERWVMNREYEWETAPELKKEKNEPVS